MPLLKRFDIFIVFVTTVKHVCFVELLKCLKTQNLQYWLHYKHLIISPEHIET